MGKRAQLQEMSDDSDDGAKNKSKVTKDVKEFVSKNFDPEKLIERSQSDATFVKFHTSSVSDSRKYTSQRIERKGQPAKVSESSKVFFDLSSIDSEENDSGEYTKMEKRNSLDMLETISHDGDSAIHEISSKDSLLSATENRFSSDDLESIVASEDTIEPETTYVQYWEKYPLILPTVTDSDTNRQNQTNVKLSYQKLSQELESHIKPLKAAKPKHEVRHLDKIRHVLVEAWQVPMYGRDIAYGLCDVLRNEGILDMVIENCSSTNKDLLKASASVLEQCLSWENRNHVVKSGIETVVLMTKREISNHEMSYINTGILEGLFKVSEEASTKMITLGGLDVILHWSRSSDIRNLRHCAKALANLSLFGGAENQEEMAKRNVPEWLFPLAFMEDDTIKYYACLAIVVLLANKELEAAVIKSGTLELVMPFINSTKPSSFAKSDTSQQQGKDHMWLERLVPLLLSRREEAQSLAAFHFAMEAGIKEEQGKLDLFYEIGAIEPLKKVASSPNATASKLAVLALKVIGESIPHKLTTQVPVWSVIDVAHWVAQVGFKDFVQNFIDCQVDGDILLLLTEQELETSIKMDCKIARKRFLRELKSLKITADYSSCDPSQMDAWLMKILPDLSQYTYEMLKAGMNKEVLASTNNEELEIVCGIKNGIHRRLMLEHVEDLYTALPMPKYGSIGSLTRQKSIDPTGFASYPKAVDVFISYRRSNGSQLASLLKVHLQLRGFSVFLDIDRLRAGKFDENLLMNIRLAKHFLLVLTPSALDRCIGDDEQQDWIHKEIVTALESDCNIIPVLDNFDWPLPEVLPPDMQQVVYFNGVRWVHDYQDACMAKLETFLKKVPIARLKSEELPTIVERPVSECDSVSSALTVEEMMAQEEVVMRKSSTDKKEARKRASGSAFMDTLTSLVENF
ncbi:NAD(+) hydrolase sarm1-like isoform X3 [Ostrea edulis]|uniref:NAD(+) hydrolase sarm1-like isoform X3 n=1 Tax=Ostrea edulis TaxID=37623 RepID=UPI002094D982|nr:NAD(+) hydrolase sarm1-like isoform X3 [Ostrea edulis]XP_056009749.1 NAD(+) hydrolase sarm1-like isoform X3 [Ostrea edulis]